MLHPLADSIPYRTVVVNPAASGTLPAELSGNEYYLMLCCTHWPIRSRIPQWWLIPLPAGLYQLSYPGMNITSCYAAPTGQFDPVSTVVVNPAASGTLPAELSGNVGVISTIILRQLDTEWLIPPRAGLPEDYRLQGNALILGGENTIYCLACQSVIYMDQGNHAPA